MTDDQPIGKGATTLDYLKVRYEWLGVQIDEADAIVKQLRARVAELEAALKPLASYPVDAADDDAMPVAVRRVVGRLTVGNVRRAAAALKGEKS